MNNHFISVGNLIKHIIQLSKTHIPENKIEIFRQTLIDNLKIRVNESNEISDRSKELFFIRYLCQLNLKKNIDIELKIEHKISEEIEIAYKKANISENAFRSSLPRKLKINIDLQSVTFKIGDKGPDCVIFSIDVDMPWTNTELYDEKYKIVNERFLSYENIAIKTKNYLKFKSTFYPWDGRRLEFIDHHIDIDGNHIECDEWDCNDIKNIPIVTENEDLVEDFRSFKKWIRKHNNIKHGVTAYDAAEEFVRHANGDPPSKLFQANDSYVINPEEYIKLFKYRKSRPKNNLYWLAYPEEELIYQ